MRTPALVGLASVLAATSGSAATKREEPPLPSVKMSATVVPAEPTRWFLRLSNDGDIPLRIVEDLRLLSFDVTPPDPPPPPEGSKPRKPSTKGKKHVKCVFPADGRPASDTSGAVVVKPGASIQMALDPRYVCFGAANGESLAPGASFIAHYGFSPSRSKVPAPPFVAAPLDELGITPRVAGTREIVAPPEALSDKGAPPPATSAAPKAAETSASSRDPSAGAQEPPPPLALSSTTFVDARRRDDVTTTVAVRNVGRRAVRLLFRPGTIGFFGDGPTGPFWCSPPGAATNIPELYAGLGPKGSTSTALGLAANCPAKTFERAGIYRLTAVLDTRRSEGMIGSTPVAAELVEAPASLVRVRTGMGDGRLDDLP